MPEAFLFGGMIRDAADDPMVGAIVLRMNSPGGTPAGAQEIVADVLYAKERKPVVVSLGDRAVSSASYISVYADRISASPDTLTGGIGTAWIFTDISGWMEEENLEIEVITSGSMNDMGAECRPLTEEERRYAGKIVNQSAERFVSDILSQRPINRSIIEDARIFRGEAAVDLGLIDEIGNLHDAIAGARALPDAGLDHHQRVGLHVLPADGGGILAGREREREPDDIVPGYG